MITTGDAALLTAAEVAARLCVPVTTVESLRRRGDFAPAIRIGRSIRWQWTDVELWVRDQKESA